MKTGYDTHFKKIRKTGHKLDLSQLSKTTKKPKKPFPIGSFFLFIFLGGVGFFILENLSWIEQQISKIEITMGMAVAETAKPTSQPTTAAAKAPETKMTQASSEADYLFKLSERKKQLDQREEELNKFAEDLSKQKEEIDNKLKNLESIRSKISSVLEERIKADENKIDTLVQVYTNMKPQQAAKVFEVLDEDLVIEILAKMKKKNAADIMNLIKSEKAQVLSEKFSGYRMPANNK